MSKHTPRDERRRIVSAWRDSGLSQRAYADEHGLVLSSLRRWARHERDDAGDREGAVRFVEVKRPAPPPPPAATGLLRVTVGRDVRLEFDRLPDAVWLASFIGAATSC